MLIFLLICTLIGWLCGYPITGLLVGLICCAFTLAIRWWNV